MISTLFFVSIWEFKLIKVMKKSVLALLAIFVLISCEKWRNNPNPTLTSDYRLVTGHITEDTYWMPDSAYEMVGKVVVDSGVTLTISPGTLIYGRIGDGTQSTALIVSRGAKIIAEGTALTPITFTSVLSADQDLDENDNGLWGGLVILGSAPISADATPSLIEGIPANETYGLYGGTDLTDNSGILRYISIRHGGALLGDGNELNGLTLGGVGSGTIIDNIEVVGNLDDGIECFGGCATLTNTLVWAQGDDAFDIDQAFFGEFINFVSIEGSSSDHALEIDGGEGDWNAPFSMTEGTLISLGISEIHFRDKAVGSISFEGMVNIEADTLTNVIVDTLHGGADLTKFNWTMAHYKGAL